MRDTIKEEAGRLLTRGQIHNALNYLNKRGVVEVVERGNYWDRKPTTFRLTGSKLPSAKITNTTRVQKGKGFQIEKGIPIPGTGKHSGEAMLPFGKMKVGDSFVVPMKFFEGHRNPSSSLNGRMKAARKRSNNRKGFLYRTLPNKEGFRVWRVK